MSTIIEETVELPAELEQAEDEILILRKAYDLLADKENWCACRDVRTTDSREGATPWDEDVVQRCVVSAVAWASGEPFDWKAYVGTPRFVAARERLGREIGDWHESDDDATNKIVCANDGKDGYERIMAALRRAIS